MHGSLHRETPPGSAAALPPRSRRRWWLLFAGVAVLLVGGVVAFTRQTSGPSGDLVTAVVTRGDLEETVMATGKIQPHAYVDVGAQASGQLNRILVRIGDGVKAGDLLAEIDPQVQVAKVDADEAQLAQFNANLVEQQAIVDYNEAQYGRLSVLMPQSAVSKADFEASRRDAKTAAAKADAIRAQIRQMQSTLKADQVALGYTKIFAPMAGTVVSIDAREGQTLNAAYSTPQIMRIADLSTMTVWTQVSEADVTKLHPGMDVYFTTLGHGGQCWNARLRQILPAPQKPLNQQGQMDPNVAASSPSNNVVLYTALFDVDNAAGDLRSEMTAQVFFIAAAARGAVIAPISALRMKDGSKEAASVTVIDADGRQNDQQVRVGLRTRFEAEIVSGLMPGQRVVTGTKSAEGKGPLVRFRL